MQEFFFEEKGLYYRVNDLKKSRLTLVFVHGVYGSSSAWTKHEEKFSEKYNILNYDMRGHGKSYVYQKYEDYDIDEFVEDLNDLIDYLKIEKFILIAHSMGSLILIDYLLKYQNRVTSAILLSPNIDTGHNWLRTVINAPLLRFIKLIENKLPKWRLGGHVDYSKYPNSSDWAIKRSVADLKNTGLSTYLYCVKHFAGCNRRDAVKNITVPILIVHGKKDSIFPVKNSIEMAKEIKSSKLAVLENADHIIVINHFEEVSKIIEDFIEETK